MSGDKNSVIPWTARVDMCCGPFGPLRRIVFREVSSLTGDVSLADLEYLFKDKNAYAISLKDESQVLESQLLFAEIS